MLAAIGRPELADDPRFASRVPRIRNFQALIEILRPVFATLERDPLMARMAENQVPCAKVNGVADAMRDPEVAHLGLFHELTHPRYGTMTAMRRAARINGAREDAGKPPPALGEHTDQVLAGLGLAAADIAALRRDGII